MWCSGSLPVVCGHSCQADACSKPKSCAQGQSGLPSTLPLPSAAGRALFAGRFLLSRGYPGRRNDRHYGGAVHACSTAHDRSAHPGVLRRATLCLPGPGGEGHECTLWEVSGACNCCFVGAMKGVSCCSRHAQYPALDKLHGREGQEKVAEDGRAS